MWRQNKLSCRWQSDCKQQLSVAGAVWEIYNALAHKSACLPLAILRSWPCEEWCRDSYRHYRATHRSDDDDGDDAASAEHSHCWRYCVIASMEDYLKSLALCLILLIPWISPRQLLSRQSRWCQRHFPPPSWAFHVSALSLSLRSRPDRCAFPAL